MASPHDGRPYFFLSYARTPKRDPSDREDPDRWVYKLYKDLCGEILQMTDARPEEAGFMDREVKSGSEWSPQLTNALAKCRVFLPLYSRRYFESDACGREWFAFARREITRKARRNDTVEAIVPALWTKIDLEKIPAVAQTVQFDHNFLGERYGADGFYGIMKLQNYRGDYQLAVHRLAERIIAIGDGSIASVDDDVPDFKSLPSAFGPASASRTTGRQLRIAVLAHDTSTLPPGRASDYYGATPSSWSPYSPDYPQPVADYAMELARSCLDVAPQVEDFKDNTVSWDGNEHPTPPSVWLVDAWTGVSTAHEEQLRKLDQIEEPWVSVVIPWNSQDRGLNEDEHFLREGWRGQLA